MSALHCFECGGDCLPWVCDRQVQTPEEAVGQPMISSGSAVSPSRNRGIVHRLWFDRGVRRLVRRFW